MKTNMISSDEELLAVINQCKVCHVSMIDVENKPYVLPFNFAYQSGILYLHCGREGKKNEALRKNPLVCVAFTVEKDLYVQSKELGCSYSMMFESVLLFGEAEEVNDFDEKTEILHRIMHKYTPNRDYSFARPSIENVFCYKIKPTKISGRKRG